MTLLDEIRNDAAGAAILKDWLGDGGAPVAPVVAEARAMVCVNCPENRAPYWWEKAKNSIADAIRAHLVVKQQSGLRVSHEDEIHMCRVCGCCLRLKVWVPIEHIKEHTTPETLAKLPSHCWLLKEIGHA